MLNLHMNFLFLRVIFPTVRLTPEVRDLFESDHNEFVHQKNSLLAKFYGPRMTAITLITDIFKHCGKDVTQSLLGLLTEIMSLYA